MTYLYQNKLLLKMSLVLCAFCCAQCSALPGLDDEVSLGTRNTKVAALPLSGCGAFPTDLDPPEVVTISSAKDDDNTSNPVDMRKGYVRRHDPQRGMDYYEKEETWSVQSLKEAFWKFLIRMK